MGPKNIMAAFAIFAIGTILSMLASGVWFAQGEIDVINALASFNTMSVAAGGVWNAPKTLGTYWDAMITMLSWSYPYLSSAWVFPVKLILWTISIGVVWGLIVVFATIIQGLVGIARSLLPG